MKNNRETFSVKEVQKNAKGRAKLFVIMFGREQQTVAVTKITEEPSPIELKASIFHDLVHIHDELSISFIHFANPVRLRGYSNEKLFGRDIELDLVITYPGVVRHKCPILPSLAAALQPPAQFDTICIQN